MRVMIAGGGTGGHIYPGIAMYNALKRAVDDVDVLFVGARSGVENKIFPELGLPHVLLPGRGVRGKGLLSKLTSPVVILRGVIGGIREILSFKPDVVIGTGGYASFAVVAASVICRRPRALQEQNSVPGMTNRVLSRFADLVLLSFEESKAFVRGGVPVAVVGNPIRVDLSTTRVEGLEFFGLSPAVPTVLVCGGSRGARSINTSAAAAAREIMAKRDVQFIFLTGEGDFETVNGKLGEFKDRVRVLPFLQEMNHAYRAADIAVSRAGASAVFELAAFGVPTVFVPYPYAADDHQKKNAAGLETLDAAVVVDDGELSGENMGTIIEALLDDEAGRKRMENTLLEWAKPDADDLAAEKIIELVVRTRSESVSSRVYGVPGRVEGM
jgi:UDP-N-acetylglucosamine--N-acetylmuramyl-(pentapeptide) pyrophosphoryl-undecaprenol N-acetylglucosamine transferase